MDGRIDRLGNGRWKVFGGRQPNMKTRLFVKKVRWKCCLSASKRMLTGFQQIDIILLFSIQVGYRSWIFFSSLKFLPFMFLKKKLKIGRNLCSFYIPIIFFMVGDFTPTMTILKKLGLYTIVSNPKMIIRCQLVCLWKYCLI